MQLAVIEYARHVAGLERANSREIDPATPHPVIDLLPEQRGVRGEGRDDAARRLAVRALAGHARVRVVREQPRSPSATATATSSTPSTASGSRRPASCSRAPPPTGGWSRSSRWPTTRGSWAASSTPSSRRRRSGRTRCSWRSWRPRSSAGARRRVATARRASHFGGRSATRLGPGTLAQLVERCVHTAEVTGSSPVRPTSGPVAQLDRAPASEAGGRAFESRPGHHKTKPRQALSQPGLLRITQKRVAWVPSWVPPQGGNAVMPSPCACAAGVCCAPEEGDP